MTVPQFESEIVEQRRPDRKEYGSWEPYTKGTRKVIRPVSGSLLRGITYEEREEDIIGWRRRVTEYWDVPERRWAERGTLNGEMTLTQRTSEAYTIGRWHWEYERP